MIRRGRHDPWPRPAAPRADSRPSARGLLTLQATRQLDAGLLTLQATRQLDAGLLTLQATTRAASGGLLSLQGTRPSTRGLLPLQDTRRLDAGLLSLQDTRRLDAGLLTLVLLTLQDYCKVLDPQRPLPLMKIPADYMASTHIDGLLALVLLTLQDYCKVLDPQRPLPLMKIPADYMASTRTTGGLLTLVLLTPWASTAARGARLDGPLSLVLHAPWASLVLHAPWASAAAHTSAPRRPSSLRSTCSIGLLVGIFGPQRRPTSAPRRPPSLRSMSSSPELLVDIFAATSAAAQGPHDGHYSLREFSLLFFTRSVTDDSYPCTCPSAVQDMGGGGMVTRYQDRTIKHTISTTPNKQKRISTPDRTKKRP